MSISEKRTRRVSSYEERIYWVLSCASLAFAVWLLVFTHQTASGYIGMAWAAMALARLIRLERKVKRDTQRTVEILNELLAIADQAPNVRKAA